MVSGSRVDGGAPGIPVKHRKTVQSIKEVASNHSEAEIYAVLKETNMDPDETAQKLLNQDPFHEVRRKRDKKKENVGYKVSPEHVGYKVSTEPRKQFENSLQWTNYHPSSDRNGRRGVYTRSTPGISHEFRVVRDNRINQIANGDAKQESLQGSVSRDEHATTSIVGKSSSEILINKRPPTAENSDVKLRSLGPNNSIHDSVHNKAAHFNITRQRLEVVPPAISNTILGSENEVGHNSEMHPTTPAQSSSATGVYSSSSDPVHVPSPDPRSAGTVGAIRREVGVVGKRSTPQSSVPSGGKTVSSTTESHGQALVLSKSTQFNQTLASDHMVSGNSVGRSFSSNQHSNKQHQPSMNHQKAMQSAMEWKPKSTQKSSTTSTGMSTPASTPSLPLADGSVGLEVEINSLSDKLSQANIYENVHVIIPQHLRVPEAERAHVTFGSFGTAAEPSEDSALSLPSLRNVEDPVNKAVQSLSIIAPAGLSGDASAEGKEDIADSQPRNSRSDSPASVADSEQSAPGNTELLSAQTIENYSDIGLVQSHGLADNSLERHEMQPTPDLPSFSEAYDIPQNFEVPFFRSAMEDNARGQGLASLPEVSSHVSSSSPASVSVAAQQQSLTQQPVAQLYPQVQFSHFPSYLPYRQFISPMYVPPMPMPSNFTSNPAYPHPSNGSSFLLMPGATSHLTPGGMKYAASQYKPAPAGSPTGYGNYTNPAGYTVSSPGAVGNPTGLEDVSRIKYKDNSLYVPNPQAETTSEIWVQTPRDVAGMQSPHYYNIPGQSPHAAFLPTHAGHASFNAAAQPSHIQFPGLYHPPQPTPMANPHHMVHQQVPPSMGGNVGVGIPTPTPQIGSYPQTQLSHLNWTNNF